MGLHPVIGAYRPARVEQSRFWSVSRKPADAVCQPPVGLARLQQAVVTRLGTELTDPGRSLPQEKIHLSQSPRM